MADLDDLLSGFGASPAPLAGPDAVRARGEQRRRRGRAAIASVAAVAVLGAGGLGLALAGSDGPLTLEPAPVATDPVLQPVPTSSTGSWDPFDGLLTAAEASAAERPGWTGGSAPVRVLVEQLLDPCRDGALSQRDVVTAAGRLGSVRETGGSLTDQLVTLYRSGPAAAGSDFQRLRDEVSRCSDRPGDPALALGDRYQVTVVQEDLGSDVQRLLVRHEQCFESCEGLSVTYVSIVQTGDGLSVLEYAIGEDGDPADDALAIHEAATEAFVEAVRRPSSGPPPTPLGPPRFGGPISDPSIPFSSPFPGLPVDDLLLSVADADEAEPGDWATLDAPEGPLLDPCVGGTDYPRDADRTATASVALQTLREAGGTDVRQTLARYTSPEAAADAAAGYERAVQGCPDAGPGSDPVSASYQVVRSDRDDATTTIVVRKDEGPGFASYLAVQQRGDLVSVLSVGYGEDGDPGVAAIEPYLPVVAEALAQG